MCVDHLKDVKLLLLVFAALFVDFWLTLFGFSNVNFLAREFFQAGEW